MANPRLILAAPKSGSGKTLITCALLQALKDRHLEVNAFKCGPDYIDPMFHRMVLDIPSRNLDLYFTGEEETKALFLQDNHSDISVIEGVMGLYDGLGGISEEASAYHLAKVLQAPIVLVVNVHGMGRSLLAEIAGFLAMDKEKLIGGVILNQISESFYKTIAPLVEAELQIKVLGYFPTQKDLQLDSRYLGLKLPDEMNGLQEKVRKAAEVLEKSVDVSALLEMASSVDAKNPLQAKDFPWLDGEWGAKDGAEKVTIGVALDEAFCFYYQDNFRLLRDAGAKLVFFSPLKDKELPAGLDGLLFGGGYPELVAGKLAENTSMLTAVRNALQGGMPSLAECGGFMYLHDTITDAEGIRHSMVGAVAGGCFDTGKLVRFGYAQFEEENFPAVKGHEFHYYDSENCGNDFTAVKPITGRSWKCMHKGDNHLWGYGHLYYPSCPEMAKWFVEACRTYKEETNR